MLFLIHLKPYNIDIETEAKMVLYSRTGGVYGKKRDAFLL